jgi:hypothetical protein
VTRLSPGAPIWFCHPRALVCRYNHPFCTPREHGMAMHVRGGFHLFLECKHCRPHTYAFGVSVSDPDDYVTLFAVDGAELFADLLRLPGGTGTLTILDILGYRHTEAA